MGRSNDGGYVVPSDALEKADILLGYGINDDASFEEGFAEKYQKPSYGFDCGVEYVSKHRPFHFINECLVTDETLIFGQKSTRKISTFEQQLTKLNLAGKKMFIKMDIEGAEFTALPGILKYSDDITGLVLELHLLKPKDIAKAVELLSMLEKDFLLLHVHGNNYCPKYFSSKRSIGKVPGVLEITYINKSLVAKYNLSANQMHPTKIDMPNDPAKKDIEFEVVLK